MDASKGIRLQHFCFQGQALLITTGFGLFYPAGKSGRGHDNFLPLQVRRSHAFEDAFRQVKACEWLQTRQGSILISPRFVDEAAGEPSALEPGEGHGPRKEFFLLAGQGMLQQPEGARYCWQLAQCCMPMLTQPASDRSSAQSLTCVSMLGTGSLEMEVVARPAQPLFLYYSWSACYWFNTTLKESSDLRAKFKFAGWLLGQSFANRASLGAAFPAVLFEKLLKGGNFQVRPDHKEDE